jgi:hypothetical protein
MTCANRCYEIGGPFITYDPDCPEHGDDARTREAAASQALRALEDRVTAMEAEPGKTPVPPPEVQAQAAEICTRMSHLPFLGRRIGRVACEVAGVDFDTAGDLWCESLAMAAYAEVEKALVASTGSDDDLDRVNVYLGAARLLRSGWHPYVADEAAR